jgi:hypothetical protein
MILNEQVSNDGPIPVGTKRNILELLFNHRHETKCRPLRTNRLNQMKEEEYVEIIYVGHCGNTSNEYS